MSTTSPPPQPWPHRPELLTRCCELESSLRHHHDALVSFHGDLVAESLMAHHVREACRRAAEAIAQLYIARKPHSAAGGFDV